MKTLLICPSNRPNVSVLGNTTPLVLAPALGQTLVEYWLTYLAGSGARQVQFLSNDRTEHLRELVSDGARWGLTVEVTDESRELSPAEALVKYDLQTGATNGDNITVLDHFPGLAEHSLFQSYEDWFAGVRAWMPHARMPDRIGVRQVQPNVWAGLNTHISASAKITGPCWLGKNVFIGTEVTLGPQTIVEDGSFIESHAEVVGSYIGPDTLVGKCVEIKESLASGSTLVNWKTGSVTDVVDAFILCALRTPQSARKNWSERLAAACSENDEEVHVFWKNLLMKREG